MEKKRIPATSDKKSELESLINEQADARKSFRRRERLGDLIRQSESMSELAKLILERHERILELQDEIKLESSDLNKNDNQLMETFDNPILKWLQKEINRLERIIEDLEKRHTKWKQNKQYYISSEELAKYRLIADKTNDNRKTWVLPDGEVAVQRGYQTHIANKLGPTTDSAIQPVPDLEKEYGEE